MWWVDMIDIYRRTKICFKEQKVQFKSKISLLVVKIRLELICFTFRIIMTTVLFRRIPNLRIIHGILWATEHLVTDTQCFSFCLPQPLYCWLFGLNPCFYLGGGLASSITWKTVASLAPTHWMSVATARLWDQQYRIPFAWGQWKEYGAVAGTSPTEYQSVIVSL